MAAVSDSNDVSDIFWPGYVDAIANLAINLLFVIAIMAIVVIGATLQIQELIKRKDRALADNIAFTVMEKLDTQRGSGASQAQSSTNAESQALERYAGGNRERSSEQPNSAEGERKSSAGASSQRTTTEPVTLVASAPNQQPLPGAVAAAERGMPSPDQRQAIEQRQQNEKVIEQQQARMREQTEQLRKLQEMVKAEQEALEQARSSVAKARPAPGRSPRETSGPTGEDAEAGRVEEVTATRPAPAPDGRNVASAVQSGVIVTFAPDATLLTEEEAKDLVAKLKTFAALNSTNRWRINVATPKGFSESARLAFYRANAVRNALLREGVPGAAIDLRVLESEQATANGARVVIRPAS